MSSEGEMATVYRLEKSREKSFVEGALAIFKEVPASFGEDNDLFIPGKVPLGRKKPKTYRDHKGLGIFNVFISQSGGTMPYQWQSVEP